MRISITGVLKAWPYIAKAGHFLHLIEDNLTQLSMSGLQLWGTTYVNLHMLFLSHDHYTQAVAAGTNAVSAAAHAVKRGQILNAAADDPTEPMPWAGEAD